MKDMIKTGFFLFVVAAIAGTLLAFTEMITGPEIARNVKRAFELARKRALPTADSFREIPITGGENEVATISVGFDEKGAFVGSVQSVGPKGYGGPIEMVLGISPESRITGIQVKARKETPGLGTKLQEPPFLEKVLAVISEKKETTRFFVKKDGGDIDAVTAATVSSRAFCQGLREALSRLQTNKTQLQTGIDAGPVPTPEMPTPEGATP